MRHRPHPINRQLERDEQRRLLTQGMTRVERLVTVLRYYEELEVQEIARVLEIGEARVRETLAHVERRFRHDSTDLS
jgi:DNA-directed RNA polymerase specialized sigma subunit